MSGNSKHTLNCITCDNCKKRKLNDCDKCLCFKRICPGCDNK